MQSKKLSYKGNGSYVIFVVLFLKKCVMILLTFSSMNIVEVLVAIKLLVYHKGYLSLWRGLGPTLLRDVPFSCTHI